MSAVSASPGAPPQLATCGQPCLGVSGKPQEFQGRRRAGRVTAAVRREAWLGDGARGRLSQRPTRREAARALQTLRPPLAPRLPRRLPRTRDPPLDAASYLHPDPLAGRPPGWRMGSSAAAGAPGVALIAGVALGFGAGYVAARGATATRDAAVEALRRASDQLHETWGAARGAVQHKGLPAAAADLARGASGSLARMLRVSTSGSSGALEGAPPNGPVPAAPSSPFAAAASARPPLPGGPSVGTSGGTSVVADDDGATDDGALSPTASLAGSSVGLSRGSSSGGGARAGSSGEKLKMVRRVFVCACV